jgi:hypothetical protein
MLVILSISDFLTTESGITLTPILQSSICNYVVVRHYNLWSLPLGSPDYISDDLSCFANKFENTVDLLQTRFVSPASNEYS